MSKVRIRFWGVRGSTPSPSGKTIRYGGNTPCVEISAGRQKIICDAGTGMRQLGVRLADCRGKLEAMILLSHYHWDHVEGLPFFGPLYSKKNEFEIVGPVIGGKGPKELLCRMIAPPYFPVSLMDVPTRLRFRSVTDKAFRRGGISISPFWLSHPGGALGWRMEFPEKKSLIYISDNEPGENMDGLVSFVEGADLLIHDAQYTPDGYERHRGWGHSPFTYPVEVAIAAGVKRLILSHFDPAYSDDMLDAIQTRVRKMIKKTGKKLLCDLAHEGKIIRL